MVELRGFEPLTFSLRTRRATNCATAPKCGRNDNTSPRALRIPSRTVQGTAVAVDVAGLSPPAAAWSGWTFRRHTCQDAEVPGWRRYIRARGGRPRHDGGPRHIPSRHATPPAPPSAPGGRTLRPAPHDPAGDRGQPGRAGAAGGVVGAARRPHGQRVGVARAWSSAQPRSAALYVTAGCPRWSSPSSWLCSCSPPCCSRSTPGSTRVVPRGLAAGITVLGTLGMVFGMLSFVGSAS